jgi:hypothetical protein
MIGFFRLAQKKVYLTFSICTMATRGRFKPINPQKYVGDANNIFFRSLWESQVMKFFDSRTDVLHWGSEEIIIPYLSPEDNRVHRYFPDFFIEYRDKDGKIIKEIVEVKPLHESDSAFAKSDRSKDALAVNEAKWKAAAIFCEDRGMIFRVLTEKAIFHQGVKQPKKKKVLNGA